ncbi:hypothetical protein NE865_10196 [Phthorimaea operculella]|nr:hypothetical protein NE865_10196 [Phthorimaea operculella]
MPTKDKGDKKKALATYKEKLLTEIYYYDQRISEARNNVNKSSSYEENESSDADSDLELFMDSGPPISQLKSQHAMLKTCLQATQELTNLEVLESEVNVLVQPPVIEGEAPVTEPGTWREVTAECCVDLVPFSITFYAHRGEGTFAPIIYRGLKVTPHKVSHEAELVKSVLPGLRRPSDAVEVLRSYAVAHRSRRSSLARLADKFGAALFMEPLASGGYQLKCAGVLEISWTLQNKWSPIAPFHHRLKFDIDYMDESYIKTITSAHRQLSDPAVDTDERTLLLAKIISTCLTAQPLQDSSDQEAQNMESPVKAGGRRTTLDREPDPPNMKNKKDSEVMAPPKSLPKKVKPKTKSPTSGKVADPKPDKRPIEEKPANDNVKKAKIDKEENTKTQETKKTETTVKSAKTHGNKQTESSAKSVETSKKTETSAKNAKTASDKNNVLSDKNKESKIAANNKSDGDKAKITEQDKAVAGNTKTSENDKKSAKAKIANKSPTNTEKPNEDTGKKDEQNVAKNIDAAKSDNVKRVAKSAPAKRKSMANMQTNNEQPKSKLARKSAPTTVKKVTDDKVNPNKNEKNSKEVNRVNSAKKTDNVEKTDSNKPTDGKVIKVVKNITNEKGEVVKKVVKKLANDKPKATEKVDVANAPKTNIPKNIIKDKVASSEGAKKQASAPNEKKNPLNEKNTKIIKTTNQNTEQKDKKIPPKKSIFTANSGNVKKTVTGIQKENAVQNIVKTSKIPQKRIDSPKSVIKKMPVRESPRKPLAKTKPPLAGVNLKKTIQKPVTGIPRLLTKPKPKVM